MITLFYILTIASALALNLLAGLAIAPVILGTISSARGLGFRCGYDQGVMMIKEEW